MARREREKIRGKEIKEEVKIPEKPVEYSPLTKNIRRAIKATILATVLGAGAKFAFMNNNKAEEKTPQITQKAKQQYQNTPDSQEITKQTVVIHPGDKMKFIDEALSKLDKQNRPAFINIQGDHGRIEEGKFPIIEDVSKVLNVPYFDRFGNILIQFLPKEKADELIKKAIENIKKDNPSVLKMMSFAYGEMINYSRLTGPEVKDDNAAIGIDPIRVGLLSNAIKDYAKNLRGVVALALHHRAITKQEGKGIAFVNLPYDVTSVSKHDVFNIGLFIEKTSALKGEKKSEVFQKNLLLRVLKVLEKQVEADKIISEIISVFPTDVPKILNSEIITEARDGKVVQITLEVEPKHKGKFVVVKIKIPTDQVINNKKVERYSFRIIPIPNYQSNIIKMNINASADSEFSLATGNPEMEAIHSFDKQSQALAAKDLLFTFFPNNEKSLIFNKKNSGK